MKEGTEIEARRSIKELVTKDEAKESIKDA